MFGIEESQDAINKQYMSNVNGEFKFGWAKEWPMHRFPPEWPDSLNDAGSSIIIEEFGKILHRLVNFNKQDKLSYLVIESVKMYRNSTKERDYHIKIMKLVIVIETLLLPLSDYDPKKCSLTSLFKTRAAALTSCDKNEYKEKLKFYHKAYGIRSTVAHGRTRPKNNKKNISTIELDQCAKTIFTWIMFLFQHNDIINSTTPKDQKLDIMLENAVKYFVALPEQQSAQLAKKHLRTYP